MKFTFFIQVENGAAENATAQFSCLFTTSELVIVRNQEDIVENKKQLQTSAKIKSLITMVTI